MKKIQAALFLLCTLIVIEYLYDTYNRYEYYKRCSFLVEKIESFVNMHNKVPRKLSEVIKDRDYGGHMYWFCTDEYFDDLPGLGKCGYYYSRDDNSYTIIVGSMTIGWQTYNSKNKNKKITLEEDMEYSPTVLWYMLKWSVIFCILYFIILVCSGIINLYKK